jgi:hypothetical protein
MKPLKPRSEKTVGFIIYYKDNYFFVEIGNLYINDSYSTILIEKYYNPYEMNIHEE